MYNRGQFPAMNLLRLIIVIIGVFIALSGIGDLASGVPTTDIGQQISRMAGGWIKFLGGIAFMIVGIAPQSVRMIFRL